MSSPMAWRLSVWRPRLGELRVVARHTTGQAWPTIADASILGRAVSMGAGAHGVAVTVDADAMIAALDADISDVTDPIV